MALRSRRGGELGLKLDGGFEIRLFQFQPCQFGLNVADDTRAEQGPQFLLEDRPVLKDVGGLLPVWIKRAQASDFRLNPVLLAAHGVIP